METVLLTIPLKPFAIIPKIVLQQRNSASRHKKTRTPCKMGIRSFYPLFLFYNSSESSESIHICKLPSRYNLAYSKGSSTANEVSAHSDPYVVLNLFQLPAINAKHISNTCVNINTIVFYVVLCINCSHRILSLFSFNNQL